ncbi:MULTISPECIES: PAAR domain-containing protein [unclassified Pseudomonas]|uniref:PAAR domain-containing protein n=1 Tax=unclassified Pseudomonas TaxID=196821 RepID=UPI002113AC14|nr:MULTISPECIES: PAAR domain-containing protein [unclassified Pseudomonas]
MTKGYFIGKDDKTACGGKVLDGDTHAIMHGVARAHEGDRVTCGKDGKTYTIVGGIPYMTSNGRAVAGTLDSRSGCPCKAELIPSVFSAGYRTEMSAPPVPRRTAPPVEPVVSSRSVASGQSGFGPASHPLSPVFGSALAEEPGFYVAPESMTREALEAALFGSRDPAVMRKFQALNPGLGDVKAGSMIVLGDPKNTSCTYQEAQLMQAAQQVKAALEPLTPDEAEFMHRHAAEIASFTGQTSTWLGVSAAMMEQHLNRMRDTLLAMERLHQDTYRQHGHLRSPQFFQYRKHLLSQLDAQLLNSTRLRGQTTLGDHPKLKTALGISSRSLVHRWDKAGGPGQIPGYATHVDATSRAAKYMQTGGYIGIGLGAVSSLLAIQEVCNGGSGEACEKVWFTEGGKFTGSVFGGSVGAALGQAVSESACVALKRTPVGGVICVLIGTGVVHG